MDTYTYDPDLARIHARQDEAPAPDQEEMDAAYAAARQAIS